MKHSSKIRKISIFTICHVMDHVTFPISTNSCSAWNSNASRPIICCPTLFYWFLFVTWPKICHLRSTWLIGQNGQVSKNTLQVFYVEFNEINIFHSSLRLLENKGSFLGFLALFGPFCPNMPLKMQISTKIFFWDCFLCSFRWYEQIKMNRDFFYLIEFLLAQWAGLKKW